MFQIVKIVQKMTNPNTSSLASIGEVLSAKLVELIHNCEKQYDGITDDCDRVVKVAACFKRDAKKENIAPEVAMIEAVMEKY